MTVEQRPELPQGYVWKEIPSIGARFTMPDTWFYRDMSAISFPGPGMTNAYFLTRESINSSKPIVKRGETLL